MTATICRSHIANQVARSACAMNRSLPLFTKGWHGTSIGREIKRLPPIKEVDCEDDEDLELAMPFVGMPDCPPEWCSGKSRVDPLCLSANSGLAATITKMLTDSCQIDRSRIIAWLIKAVPSLATSEHGSIVVKKAIETATGSDRNLLLAALHGSVLNLYKSPFGHEVLARLIEVMPVAAIGFVIAEITGRTTLVAQHKFGCHIIELLIMHCKESQMIGLMDELVQDVESLSRHQYGNTVIQHLIEYGSERCREQTIQRLLPHVPLLIMHSSGSHVIQGALYNGNIQEQQSIILSLLQASKPVSLADIACSRCGTLVLETIHGIGIHEKELYCQLERLVPRLQKSKFGRRIICLYELSP